MNVLEQIENKEDDSFSVCDFVTGAAMLFSYAAACGAGWVLSVKISEKLFNTVTK